MKKITLTAAALLSLAASIPVLASTFACERNARHFIETRYGQTVTSARLLGGSADGTDSREVLVTTAECPNASYSVIFSEPACISTPRVLQWGSCR